ncbi:50S ribosomal protein L29 [Euryarchaeota archaeon ex4484_162]|nr:MAG: 50S ribosomal protein L29 [Euryarchaeota archaeon ex4484_162]RLF62272.1 MAG: 50S ribosomal protein L29 [Thermoplasmata archaeon]HDM25147.1 50S ribosomal protein L29 [Thermoplasmatales archaeon]
MGNILKARDIRQLTPEERKEKLKELKEELMHERGVSAMGGSPPSPGKIRQLRTSIARLLTIMREEGEIK